MMANVRIYSATAKTVSVPSGRIYTVAAGGILDIPEGEIEYLDWRSQTIVLLGATGHKSMRSGTTAQRPTIASARAPVKGEPYIDTTLGYVVFFVGPQEQPGGTWVSIAGSTV
jgi:hypothetical protein